MLAEITGTSIIASMIVLMIVVVTMMTRNRKRMQTADVTSGDDKNGDFPFESSPLPNIPKSTRDTIRMAERVRVDQGYHESEVSFGGEADLHQHMSGCLKNPGHAKFIPIQEFDKRHLPAFYQDDDVVEMVKALAAITFRVAVNYTSEKRPDIYPNSREPYPFHSFKGMDYLRTGTGWVDFVQLFSEDEGKLCPCTECCKSLNPQKNWGNVYLATAAHVVHDDLEAQQVTCHFFYDTSETKLDNILSLKGLRMADLSLVHRDWCWMRFITHDTALLDKLSSMVDHYKELVWKVEAKFMFEESVNLPVSPSDGSANAEKEDKGEASTPCSLTVIVSHPHGCSKQVTVGESTHTSSMRYKDVEYIQYIYTASTCPGSSGGPVYIIGQKQRWLHVDYPHSKRCVEDGLNMSGFGCKEY